MALFILTRTWLFKIGDDGFSVPSVYGMIKQNKWGEKMHYTELNLSEFTETLASKSPVPGGGGASALAGAVGLALGNMVASLTLNSPKYQDVHGEIKTLLREGEALRVHLLSLIDEDAKVFAPLAEAYKMPKATEAEQALKDKVMASCLTDCCAVPLAIMKDIARAIALIERYAAIGSAMALSDAGAGAIICQGALKAASLNITINTAAMKDRKAAEAFDDESQKILDEWVPRAEAVWEKVRTRLS